MNQYLILHKVRNEAAFDIAEKSQCPECSEGCDECDHRGYWWICSTSGHRAHPYKWWDMDDFGFDNNPITDYLKEPIPPSWPDHYPMNKAPAFDTKAFIANLTANVPKQFSDLKRRV